MKKELKLETRQKKKNDILRCLPEHLNTNKLSIIINLTVTPMAEQSELIVNVLRVCIKFNRAKKFCSSSIPNNVLDKKLPLTTITT